MRAHVLRLLRHAALLLATSALVVATAGGCNQGTEGDRCNPLLDHNECNNGLVCSGPGTSYPLPGYCVENYCCPTDPTKSSNPDCNGTDPMCSPPPDAGTPDTGSAPPDGGAG